MFTIDHYIRPKTLEEAYELNQKKNNVVLGGNLWLRMGKKHIATAIDLSDLGLNFIEEKEDRFEIGCMCTLRDIEVSKELNRHFGTILSDAVSSIVGVQFRNLATVGGSVYSRFGFSDVLTALLALDTHVKLYRGGMMSLEDFLSQKEQRDILVGIIIKKDGRKGVYLSHRMTKTDFPILNCAISRKEGKWKAVLGARPMRAMEIPQSLGEHPTEEEINQWIKQVQAMDIFGDNMRASAQYRRTLAGVLLKRGIAALDGGTIC